MYVCKSNIELGLVEVCYNIKDQYTCENSHTFTDLSHRTDHIGLTNANLCLKY